jgi:hypothetical protein
VPGDEMGFLACLFRCPQEDLVEEDGDEEEGEQYRINRQVASGDDAHGLLSCVLFFFCYCSRCSILFLAFKSQDASTRTYHVINVLLLYDAFLIICKES